MTTSTLPQPAASRPLYEGGPMVSSVAWGMWRFAGDDVGAATARVQAALDAGVTLFDTAGCSCEQIIERSGLGEGHTKFGCSVGVMKNWVEQVAN